MNRNAMKALVCVALLAAAGVPAAQDAARGSLPPGTSQDGSSAAEGAIKGGSIAPGERSGVPEKDISRCKELTGTLREQCLKDAESASTGTTAPGTLPKPDPNVRDPRQAPPPQNPR